MKDQMIRIIIMEKDNMSEMFESSVKKIHDEVRGNVEQFFPNLIKKVYVINPPKKLYMIFKAISWTFSKKKKDRFCPLGSDYVKVLDKEIGLHRLPPCVGGTNPVTLENANCFWNEEYQLSFKEKRFGLK
jgi:hypothetical protein